MKNLILIFSIVVLFACKKEAVEPKKTTKTVVVETITSSSTGTNTTSYKIFVNGVEKSHGSYVEVGMRLHYDYEGNTNDIVKVELYGNSYSKNIIIKVEGTEVTNQTNTLNPFSVSVTIP